MIVRTNQIYSGSNGRESVYDICYEENGSAKPVIIFSHGFKGFKDWGGFNYMADFFAKKGAVCIKFNFSHNGGTIENPIDFPDLEAFSKNTYTKELEDLNTIIDLLFTGKILPQDQVNLHKVGLIGHSRGGGISTLQAARDRRINWLITWASVGDFSTRFLKGRDLENWKKKGFMIVKNGRTKQEMPIKYSYYSDFIQNKELLDIPQVSKKIKIPTLIIHGTNDQAVSLEDAHTLNKSIENSKIHIIPNTNHTFDMKHPLNIDFSISAAFKDVLNTSVDFIFKNT